VALLLNSTGDLAAVMAPRPCQNLPSLSESPFAGEAIVMYTWIGRLYTRVGNSRIVRLVAHSEMKKPGPAARSRGMDRRGFLKGVLASSALTGLSLVGESVIGNVATLVAYAASTFNAAVVEAWFDSQQLVDSVTGKATALIRSFQTNPPDPRVPDSIQQYSTDFSNTYDNAVFGINELESGRPDAIAHVRAILTYFQAQGIPNRSNKEPFIFTGEAMWAGLLALHYARITGDDQFEPLLLALDKYVLDDRMNLNGAVMGTPGLQPGAQWASTEHNLDVLQYLQNRYQLLLERNLAGDTDQATKVRALQTRVAGWLVNKAYIPVQQIPDPSGSGQMINDPNTGCFLRGDGDTHFAADTHFWGIDILTNINNADGQFFKDSGLATIDLKTLMRVAEAKSRVDNYTYQRLDGTAVILTGFTYQDRASNPTSPMSFEWTAMAARAYAQLGETDNANLILYGKTDGSGNKILGGLQDAMFLDANGLPQSLAYADQPGYPFNDNPDWFATAYPSVAATSWATIALRTLPLNIPFSFGVPVLQPASVAYPPAPSNVVPIIGVPNVVPASGDPVQDWVSEAGNLTFDFSGLQKLRITFSPGSSGKYFRLRLLPQGADSTADDWLNLKLYRVPDNGVLEISLDDFATQDAVLQNGKLLTSDQLKSIASITLYSGDGSASFNGAHPITTGQTAKDVVSFLRIQGIPPSAPVTPPVVTVVTKPIATGVSGSNTNASWFNGQPTMDLTGLQGLRFSVTASNMPRRFLLRLLPQPSQGAPDYGSEAYVRDQYYEIPAGADHIDIPLSDFTNADLHSGRPLSAAGLANIVQVSLHAGDNPWGDHPLGQSADTVIIPTRLDGIVSGMTAAAAKPQAVVQSEALAFAYARAEAVVERAHREGRQSAPLNLRYVPHGAISLRDHSPILRQIRYERLRSAGVHEMRPAQRTSGASVTMWALVGTLTSWPWLEHWAKPFITTAIHPATLAGLLAATFMVGWILHRQISAARTPVRVPASLPRWRSYVDASA